MVNKAKKELRRHASSSQAAILQRFFKTGPGEYGEGDIFIGVKVPDIRKTAAAFSSLQLSELQKLISSPVHEERLLALIILTQQFAKADPVLRDRIIKFYLRNRKFVNNWDLVDLSAPYLLGPYLYDKDKDLLFRYAKNGTLWEKRIAVLSTFYFIKQGVYDVSLALIEILLEDRRDLINKACGWMLREIGKKDLRVEEHFLKRHYRTMPRTMLRYAIEKFSEEKRRSYMKGLVK